MPRENELELQLMAQRCRRLVVAVLSEATSEHFGRLKNRVTAIAGCEGMDAGAQRAAEEVAERLMRAGVDRLIELRRLVVERADVVSRLEADRAALEAKAKAATRRWTSYTGESPERARALKKALKEANSALRKGQARAKAEALDLHGLVSSLREYETMFGATEWFLSNEQEPFSFLWCAELVGLSPSKVRSALFRLGAHSGARHRMAVEQAEWARRVAESETWSV